MQQVGILQCNPSTYGGYYSEKKVYNDSVLQAFNILVEISNDKTPGLGTSGNTENVLKSDTSGNGYISCCVRLSLLSSDIVQPYVSIIGVNNVAFSDDAVPSIVRTCDTISIIVVPMDQLEVAVHWTVRGALTINDTQVWAAYASDLSIKDHFDCRSQPNIGDIQSVFTPADLFIDSYGSGNFSSSGTQPVGASTRGPLFSAFLRLQIENI